MPSLYGKAGGLGWHKMISTHKHKHEYKHTHIHTQQARKQRHGACTDSPAIHRYARAHTCIFPMHTFQRPTSIAAFLFCIAKVTRERIEDTCCVEKEGGEEVNGLNTHFVSLPCSLLCFCLCVVEKEVAWHYTRQVGTGLQYREKSVGRCWE